MKGRIVKKLLATFAALSLSAAAHAGSISTFGSLAGYQAAIGAAPETFEDFTSTSHFPITTGVLNSATNLPGIGVVPGTIQAGVTYSTSIGTGNFFNIDAGGGFNGGFLDGFEPSNRVLNITFDSAAGAFGFVTNTLMQNFDITINFTSGSAYTGNFSVAGGGLEFFGFQSSLQDITSIIVDGNGSFFGFALDDFRFTGASGGGQVPEPVGLAFLGFAALLVCGRRKRV